MFCKRLDLSVCVCVCVCVCVLSIFPGKGPSQCISGWCLGHLSHRGALHLVSLCRRLLSLPGGGAQGWGGLGWRIQTAWSVSRGFLPAAEPNRDQVKGSPYVGSRGGDGSHPCPWDFPSLHPLPRDLWGAKLENDLVQLSHLIDGLAAGPDNRCPQAVPQQSVRTLPVRP